MIKNFIKVLFLRLKGDHLGKGKAKYKITLRDVFFKIFKIKSQFKIECVMCGYPRSGTHWISNVVQKSSDLYSPDYAEIDYKMALDKHIPLIKIHARSKSVLKLKMFLLLPPHIFKKKYIYTYRDPRDAIISLYNMYNILKNKNLSQKEFLNIYDPIGQYKWEIKSWVLNNKSANVLTVRFEDLKNDTTNIFNKIFSFININENVNYESLNEFVGVVEKNNRKKGAIYGWKENYDEYIDLIEEINKDLSEEIVKLGYDINR